MDCDGAGCAGMAEWFELAWAVGSSARDDSCDASCGWLWWQEGCANNGVCNEPAQTTGKCEAGTDCSDCGGCSRAARTLPNLLGEACASGAVLGASTGGGGARGLNVAQSGARAKEALTQAVGLVAKAESLLGGAAYATTWKLVTMLLGGNDLCNVCSDGGDVSADEYAAKMRPAFETLAAVPRLVVNVPLHADYTQLAGVDWGFFGNLYCDVLLALVCPCMGNWASDLAVARQRVGEYNGKLVELVAEFNGDAHASTRGQGTTFIVQPFAQHTVFSATHLVSDDCFHPSAAGQELLARGLWNNLLQPAGEKASSVEEGEALLCPTADAALS
mmetsp:Transcript_35161/g.104732  ORF Transcript_35161/g.104732 Transcript_35161/m.104732 type:complete len:332 (-) Transcript_35161:141-1136(-)